MTYAKSQRCLRNVKGNFGLGWQRPNRKSQWGSEVKGWDVITKEGRSLSCKWRFLSRVMAGSGLCLSGSLTDCEPSREWVGGRRF